MTFDYTPYLGNITVAGNQWVPSDYTFTIPQLQVASKMTGKKPIVVRPHGAALPEFDDKDAAIAEASRLATRDKDAYVVYVPVAIVRPKSEVEVESL